MFFTPANRVPLICALALIWLPTTNFVQYKSEMGAGLGWFTDKAYYYIDKAGCDDIPDNSEFVAIHNSFEAWNAIECGVFEFEFGGYVEGIKAGHNKNGKNYNLLIWINDSTEWKETKPLDVIAMTTLTFDKFTGEIVDADVEMNDFGYEFTTTDDPQEVKTDVMNTVTHEIGHMLGLDHSTIPEATMYAKSSTGDLEKRTLHADDIAGFCYIYEKHIVPDSSNDAGSQIDLYESEREPIPYDGNGCGFETNGNALALLILLGLITLARLLCSRKFHSEFQKK